MNFIWIILLNYHFNFESNQFTIDLGHNIFWPMTLFGLNVQCTFPNKTYVRLNQSWTQTKANGQLWNLKVVLIVWHTTNMSNTPGTDLSYQNLFHYISNFRQKDECGDCTQNCSVACSQMPESSVLQQCHSHIWNMKFGYQKRYSYWNGPDTFYVQLPHKISTMGPKSMLALHFCHDDQQKVNLNQYQHSTYHNLVC
jgi:hypothetical protein